MKIKIRLTALLLIICISLSLVSCDFVEELVPDVFLPDDSESYYEIQDTVSVCIMDGDNFTVTSYNPIKVRRGESASFDIVIDEGYEFVSASSDAVFSNGKITVDNVNFPISVEIETKKKSVIIETPPIEEECTDHTDGNKDKKCDVCDEDYVAPCSDHTDTNRNKKCDYCDADYIAPCSDHTDVNLDRHCDYCNTDYIATCTMHTDVDFNKKCDYCTVDYIAPCTDHTDLDRSKKCDYCDTDYIAPCFEHTDTNVDKFCDYCGRDYIAPCDNHTDTDRDKVCDYCNNSYIAPCSDHTDTNRNKKCDYCDADYIAPCSDHTDTNRNKKCDYCDEDYIAPCSDHVDTVKDQVCDYCGGNITNVPCSNHTDENNDLLCDTDRCYQKYYVEVLTPAPEEGFRFICWTLDKPAKEGGNILTEEANMTVKLPEGVTAIANYVDVEHHVILYRTNGGQVAATGNDYYYQTFSNKLLYRPNTLHQNGTFVRDGHILVRYTDNPDGSGEYTTLGGKISVNKNGFAELWLMWEKTTTKGLSYSLYENGGETVAAVSGYTGTEKKVVIPETVSVKSGSTTTTYKVDRVLKGAFYASKIESLVLSAAIKIVDDKAFEKCTALKDLTFHDNISYIMDEAFSGCTALKTVYLNAGRLPRYVGNSETLNCLKYDKIRYATDNGIKKIIVMSGSSSLYGFSAEQMEKAFDGEYAVINHGSNAGVSIHLYMEAYLNFYREGDIIIQAPETTNPTQLGECGMTYLTFRGTECMLEIFSYVDIRNYTGFFSGLTEFNRDKRNDGKEYSYETYSTTINKYTDLTTNQDKFDYTSKNTATYPYNVGNLTDARVKKMNALYDKIHATGASLYMSWAPINYDACSKVAKDPKTHKAYVDKVSSSLHITVISDPADYMLEQKYFYNSDYHPGVTGRRIRTERLIADLKAQLEKEAKQNP